MRHVRPVSTASKRSPVYGLTDADLLSGARSFVGGGCQRGELSASEQSGVDSGNPAVAAALRTANAEYERRFGRIFLIRAAGRTSADVLSELHRRLQNSDETEAAEVVGQLSEIALDRLQRVIGT